MRYLEPIVIGDLTYHDMRRTDDCCDFGDCYSLYQRILNKQMDDKRASDDGKQGGEEPGCREIRGDEALRQYRQFLKDGGTQRYETWLKEQEDLRECTDVLTDEAFLWLCFRGRDFIPEGAIGVYSIELLGPVSKDDPTIAYRAMCSPEMTDGRDASTFMRRLLDSPTLGFDDNGDSVNFQLVRWRFPTEAARNRWNFSRPVVPGLFTDLGGHTLVTAVDDGMEYPVTLDRVTP